LIVASNTSGNSIKLQASQVYLKYCSFYKNNNAVVQDPYVFSYNLLTTDNLDVEKSILYDPGSEELFSSNSAADIAVSDSISSSAEPDPQLTVDGKITKYSTARNLDPDPSGFDIERQARAGDVGADQWISTDSNSGTPPQQNPGLTTTNNGGILSVIITNSGLASGYNPPNLNAAQPPPPTGSTTAPVITLIAPTEATPLQ